MYEDNDPEEDIVEWVSKVHLMGLTSTPAVGNLAVRYAAREVPPRDGKTWMEEDDLLDPYHLKATRVPDDIETILVYCFYVDDFLFIAPSKEACQQQVNRFNEICRQWHVELKQQDDCGPSQRLVALGIEYDMVDMCRRIMHTAQG